MGDEGRPSLYSLTPSILDPQQLNTHTHTNHTISMPVNPHPTTRREGGGPCWGLGVGDAWGNREGEIQGLLAFLLPFYIQFVIVK